MRILEYQFFRLFAHFPLFYWTMQQFIFGWEIHLSSMMDTASYALNQLFVSLASLSET